MEGIEQLVEALKLMADQQDELGEMLLQQQKTAGSGGRGGGDKDWSDINRFRNVEVFGGDSREWEEIAEKFKSQVAATNVSVGESLGQRGGEGRRGTAGGRRLRRVSDGGRPR